MQRRVTVDVDAPQPAVTDAIAAAVGTDDDRALLERRGLRIEATATAHASQATVEIVLVDEQRVPFFQWFFGPVRRIELGRLTKAARRRVTAAISGEPLPPWPASIPVIPPVPFSTTQIGLVAAVCLAAAVASFGAALFGQYVDPLADSFDVSNADLGVSLAVTRAGVLFALIATALADRLGRRRVILGALVALAAGSLVSALSPGIILFTVAQLAVRAAVNSVLVVGGIAVVEEAPEGARAFAVAMLGLASGAGFALAVVLLPVADLGAEAWRVAFGLSALSVLIVPVIARNLQETRRYRQLAGRTRDRGRLREVFDRQYGMRFALLAATGFLTNVFSAPSAQLMNRFLSDERDFSSSSIALFRGVTAGLPGLIGIVVGGRLAETRGRKPVAIVSLTIGTLVTMAFFVGDGLLLWITATVGILAAAPATLSVGTLDAELFPTEVRGTSNGFLLGSYVAGSALGLVLAGTLADPIGGLGPAIAVLGVAPLLAALVLLPRLPESRGRTLDEVSPSEV